MKRNNIKIGAVITYVQLFLNILISLLYTPMILRILGPEEHGLYSTVSSIIGFLSLLSLGIGSSYIRFYSKYKAEGREDKIASLNGLFLLMFSVIGAVALLCGTIMSANPRWIFADGISDTHVNLAKILGIIVTFDLAVSFPASVFNSIIRSNENFIWVKSINMLQSVLSPLLTIPMLWMGFGSIGMVLITTVIDCCTYLMNIGFCLGKLKAKFSLKNIEKGILKAIFSFSIFIAINSMINQFNTGLDKILLARFVGTASVSVYAIGYSLYAYYGSFSGAISGLFVSHVNCIVSQYSDDTTTLRKSLTSVFVKLGRIQFLIQMLMLTGIIFFGKSFIALWAGNGYENSYYVAMILCISETIPLCQNIGTEMQRAQNKHRVRTLVYAMMTLINICLTVILCQKYGEVGAVVGTGISTILVSVIFMNIYYHKKLFIDMKEYWKNFALNCRGLMIPMIVGILIMRYAIMETWLSLVLFIAIYTIVYVISMWFIVMNEFEKDLLFGKIRLFLRRKSYE